MKRFIIVSLLLFTLVGCAAKQTPQYNAAVISDDSAHALSALITEEYTLFKAGAIPADSHKQFKAVLVQVNESGKQADLLIGQGNWSGALPLLTSMGTQLETIKPETLGIKDPNSQLLYASALSAAVGTLEITVSNVQQKAATTGGK